MRKILFSFLIIAGIQFSFSQTTTYYLIRHADKVLTTKKDPDLTTRGIKRSNLWAKVFEDVQFDIVYSTDYKRTRNTAIPTAKQKNLEVKIYEARKLFNPNFLKETKGKTILIVGHSNTIPFLANQILSSNKYQEIDERNYTNLYIVTKTEKKADGILLHIYD